MTSREVLAGVQKRGYKFSTNNPLNSLGVILYGKNPKFNRADGKFSLAGGSHVGNGRTITSVAKSGTGKSQMSPAARARIAEAQRARWAATRNGQPKASKAGPVSSGKRSFSPAARAAIAAAARKRWAAAKRAGKNSL